jgi:hypothetical protein
MGFSKSRFPKLSLNQNRIKSTFSTGKFPLQGFTHAEADAAQVDDQRSLTMGQIAPGERALIPLNHGAVSP